MVEQIWKHPAFTQRDAVLSLFSIQLPWGGRVILTTTHTKNTSVVACFIPERMRLDGMAMNEQGFESFTGTNIWRFEQATSAQVLLYPQVCLSRDMTLFDPPLHPFSSCHWHCTLSRDKPSKRCHALHYSCWAKNTITTRHEMIKKRH